MTDRPTGWWARFRAWRRGRPFWGGVFGLLCALVLIMPFGTIKIGALTLSLQSLSGMSAVLLTVVITCCAIGVWVRPEFRIVCGLVTVVAALVSLPNVNFGGFGIGLISGLVAGALMIAWSPGSSDEPPAREPSSAKQSAAERRLAALASAEPVPAAEPEGAVVDPPVEPARPMFSHAAALPTPPGAAVRPPTLPPSFVPPPVFPPTREQDAGHGERTAS